MKKFLTWYSRRLGMTFLFALPTIFAAILLGLFANETVAIIGIFFLISLNGLVIFKRKRLFWPLSLWQSIWDKIPTWREYN